MRFVLGISGASGVIYGIKLLELFNKINTIETYLIVSQTAEEIIRLETSYSRKDLEKTCYAYF